MESSHPSATVCRTDEHRALFAFMAHVAIQRVVIVRGLVAAIGALNVHWRVDPWNGVRHHSAMVNHERHNFCEALAGRDHQRRKNRGREIHIVALF